MSTHSHSHNRTKVTFDCSVQEKIYIKMLAARANMTLGEFLLSHLRKDFPSDKKKRSNKVTLAAHKEALKGKGTSYKNMDDFWADMGVTPRAKS